MVDIELKWNQRELDRLEDPAGPIGRDLERRGHNVAVTAQALAPVLTGATKAGIVSQVSKDGEGVYVDVASSAVNDKGFPYPYVHEFGDHPFLRPALDAARR